MVSDNDMTDTAPPAVVDDEATVDGRTMRRIRNRAAVIDALLSMVREGHIRPSAVDIADRAGVTDRSIFRYFADLDDLVGTAIAHAFQDVVGLTAIADIGQGTVTERIERFVDARLELLATVDRSMQLARARAHSIPSINDQLSVVADLFRRQIREHFAPELAVLDDDACTAVVDAILMLTTHDAYNLHLRVLHDDTAAFREKLNLSIAGLLRA